MFGLNKKQILLHSVDAIKAYDKIYILPKTPLVLKNYNKNYGKNRIVIKLPKFIIVCV